MQGTRKIIAVGTGYFPAWRLEDAGSRLAIVSAEGGPVRALTAAFDESPAFVAWTPDGRPFAVISFTVAGSRIVEIDVLADPDRLARLDLDVLAD